MSEKYPKPHLGQTFFRYPNQDKAQREFAMCDGFVESGEVRGELQWSATLRDGRGGTEQITNRSVLGSGSWRPLPPEELETRYGPGYRVLEERIEKYAAAARKADETLAAAVDEHTRQLAEMQEEMVRALNSAADLVQALQDRIAALEKLTAPTPPVPPVEPVGARPPPRRVVEAAASR